MVGFEFYYMCFIKVELSFIYYVRVCICVVATLIFPSAVYNGVYL